MEQKNMFQKELEALLGEWSFQGAVYLWHSGEWIFQQISIEDWEGEAQALRLLLHYDSQILQAAVTAALGADAQQRYGSMRGAAERMASKCKARSMAANEAQKSFECSIPDLAVMAQVIMNGQDTGFLDDAEGWKMAQDIWEGSSLCMYMDAQHDAFMIVISEGEDEILLNEQHLLTYLKLELRRAFDARILQAQESVLCPYDEKHMQGAVRLELKDAQYEFILDARSCICRAYALGEGARTYVLDTAGRVTGLAVILTGENETEIDAMLIDRRYQGRGFGKRMMEEILKSLKEDGTQKVLVAFSPQNTDAAAFYQACGFETAPQQDEESAFMQIGL